MVSETGERHVWNGWIVSSYCSNIAPLKRALR